MRGRRRASSQVWWFAAMPTAVVDQSTANLLDHNLWCPASPSNSALRSPSPSNVEGEQPLVWTLFIPFALTKTISTGISKSEVLPDQWLPRPHEGQSQGIVRAIEGQSLSAKRRRCMVWASTTSTASSLWCERSFANPMYTLRVVPQKHFFSSEWMCEFAAR